MRGYLTMEGRFTQWKCLLMKRVQRLNEGDTEGQVKPSDNSIRRPGEKEPDWKGGSLRPEESSWQTGSFFQREEGNNSTSLDHS